MPSKKTKHRPENYRGPRASPVRVIDADGVITEHAAYNGAELRAIRWREDRRSKSSVPPRPRRKRDR